MMIVIILKIGDK